MNRQSARPPDKTPIRVTCWPISPSGIPDEIRRYVAREAPCNAPAKAPEKGGYLVQLADFSSAQAGHLAKLTDDQRLDAPPEA